LYIPNHTVSGLVVQITEGTFNGLSIDNKDFIRIVGNIIIVRINTSADPAGWVSKLRSAGLSESILSSA
jgi:hypothetical protein